MRCLIMNRTEDLFDEVRLALTERGKFYGSSRTNHERISELWSAFLGDYISPMQVAACMSLVKFSRLSESPSHGDSLKDAIGYLAIYNQILKEYDTEYKGEVNGI